MLGFFSREESARCCTIDNPVLYEIALFSKISTSSERKQLAWYAAENLSVLICIAYIKKKGWEPLNWRPDCQGIGVLASFDSAHAFPCL